MKITLTEAAQKWFEEGYPLSEGESIRFYGKTYGNTEVHEGFSVGMSLDDPEDFDELLGSTEINGRTYFAAKSDDWFFHPYDLDVDFDEEAEAPIYHFNK